MNILRISSPGQTTNIKQQWWVLPNPICAFRLSLVWWLVGILPWPREWHYWSLGRFVYKAGSTSDCLACKCFDGKLFRSHVVWLVAQGLFAVGFMVDWLPGRLNGWLKLSFQSIITTYRFNWHVSALNLVFTLKHLWTESMPTEWHLSDRIYKQRLQMPLPTWIQGHQLWGKKW